MKPVLISCFHTLPFTYHKTKQNQNNNKKKILKKKTQHNTTPKPLPWAQFLRSKTILVVHEPLD